MALRTEVRSYTGTFGPDGSHTVELTVAVIDDKLGEVGQRRVTVTDPAKLAVIAAAVQPTFSDASAQVGSLAVALPSGVVAS